MDNTDAELNPSSPTGPVQPGEPQLLLTSLICVALTAAAWFMYHGDPRKKPRQFLFPPRPRWDVMMCILFDSISDALSLSAVPVLLCYVVGQFQTTYTVDFSTCVDAYMASVALISCLGSFQPVQNLYLVQRVKFTVAVDPLQIPLVPTLGDVLNSSNKHTRQLAFYDLMVMVDAREQRLFDLLKLTHPGRHPFAWNTVLAPMATLMSGATLYFKDFVNVVRQESRPAGSTESTKKPEPSIELITGNLLYSENEKQKSFPRLRDLVTPSQTKIVFHPGNGKPPPTPFVKTLVETPANVINSIIDKMHKAIQGYYDAKRFKFQFTSRRHISDKLKDILHEHELLVWATQILVGLSQFSITKDMNGVISTTLGRIITLHIELYNALEQLVEEFRPIRSQIARVELEKLVSLLSVYKKSLVFFYVNYAAHIKVLRIPTGTVKRWKLICYEELKRTGHTFSNHRDDMDGPTLFNDEDC